MRKETGNTVKDKNKIESTRSKIDELNSRSWDLGRVEPEKSLSLAIKAEKMARQAGYPGGRAYSLLCKGWYFFDNEHKYQLSLQLFLRACQIFEQVRDMEGTLKSYAGISGVHYLLDDYSTCLEYNEKALKLAKSINNADRQMTILISNAEVYRMLGHHDKALKSAKKAYQLGKQLSSFEQESILLMSLSNISIELEHYEKALEYIQKAYEIAMAKQNKYDICISLAFKGKVLVRLNRVSEAEKLLFEAARLSDYKDDSILQEICDFYFQTGRYEKALEYGEKAIILAKETNKKHTVKKCCQIIAQIYINKDEYRKALFYTEEAHTYEKIINNDKIETKMLNMSIKNKIEKAKKESEINRLKNVELKGKNKELVEYQQLLSTMINVGREITSALDSEKILQVFYGNITKIMNAPFCGLAFYYPGIKSIEYKIMIEGSAVSSSFPAHSVDDKNSLSAWAIRNNAEIHINDYDKEYVQYIKEYRMAGDHVSSLVFIPVTNNEKILGVITVQSPDKNAYSETDVKILRMFSSYLAVAIENSRQHERIHSLYGQLKETTAALWSEIEVAKKIQTVLLPEKPAIPGFEIAAYMECSDEVGGDYYDVINVRGKQWIVIGDVSGHGVTAGLIMMMVQTAINTILDNSPGIPPSRLLSSINKTIKNNICKLGTEKYMTITVFALIEDNKLLFSGLHQDLYIYRAAAGSVEIVETSGMWIGFVDDISKMLTDSRLEMAPGDMLVLYTDGLTEAVKKEDNPGTEAQKAQVRKKRKKTGKKKRFGNQRLIDIIREKGSCSAQSLKNVLLQELKVYDCSDDITFLILKKC